MWSSDRDLSSGRDEMVSRGEEPPKADEEEKIFKSQSRSSIAWAIDWNEKKEEDRDKSTTYLILIYFSLNRKFYCRRQRHLCSTREEEKSAFG